MDDIIIGRNSVLEALDGNRTFRKICLSEGKKVGTLLRIYTNAKEKNIPVQDVSDAQLSRLCGEEHHQGVVAYISPVAFADLTELVTSALQTERAPLFVLPDGVEDVHNLGAIIRSAECAGVKGILLPKRHAAPLNQTVAKTSAGALEHMPIAQIGNVVQTLNTLKKQGFWIVGADMDGEIDYFHADLNMPIVLVVGNEGKGLSRLTRENCDILVRIPMYGKVNSLNASVAASLLIYEVLRQRSSL